MAWNTGKTTAPAQKPKRGGVLRGLIALIVVVGGAVAAWVVMFGAPALPGAKPAKERRAIAGAIADKPADLAPVHELAQTLSQAPTADAPFGFGPDGRPLTIYDVRKDIDWDRITNRTFKTGTEQLLSWICHTELGDMPMPIPSLSEEERDNLVAILISHNEIKETDSEEAKNAKEMVGYAKREMLEFIKEGGDPDDFMQFYFQELKKGFEKRNNYRDEVEQVIEEEPELAAEFVEKVNEVLDAEGIKPLRYNEETREIY